MKRNFYEFCEIIKILRSPEGCPWDREQTHETLAKHLLEEAYEAYDAVFDGNSENMADELGDVLLQIVMHAEIGSEQNEFDIDDVITAVYNKMVDRHPHVFGNEVAETSGEVLKKWEEIKKAQRGQQTVSESMEGITRSLPALSRCCKVISKAGQMDIEYPKNRYVQFDSENVTNEDIGEALFEICRIASQKGIDCETELSSKIKKFIKKVKNIEENT